MERSYQAGQRLSNSIRAEEEQGRGLRKGLGKTGPRRGLEKKRAEEGRGDMDDRSCFS